MPGLPSCWLPTAARVVGRPLAARLLLKLRGLLQHARARERPDDDRATREHGPMHHHAASCAAAASSCGCRSCERRRRLAAGSLASRSRRVCGLLARRMAVASSDSLAELCSREEVSFDASSQVSSCKELSLEAATKVFGRADAWRHRAARRGERRRERRDGRCCRADGGEIPGYTRVFCKNTRVYPTYTRDCPKMSRKW